MFLLIVRWARANRLQLASFLQGLRLLFATSMRVAHFNHLLPVFILPTTFLVLILRLACPFYKIPIEIILGLLAFFLFCLPLRAI